MREKVTATAVIAVRNGAAYLDGCIRHLRENGLSIIFIDNESTDETNCLLEAHLHRGTVEAVHHLPFHNNFDLSRQLAFKQELMQSCDTDWVVHLDVDEMPHSEHEGETLVDVLARAQGSGFNAINFQEFVFLPLEGPCGFASESFPSPRHFYFFEPEQPRLIRAWRSDLPVTNTSSGGHKLVGEGIRLFPEFLPLRHYMFLSQQHAFQKYVDRVFSPEDLSKWWHSNRIGFDSACFAFPRSSELELLNDVNDRRLSRARPYRKHYWEWT